MSSSKDPVSLHDSARSSRPPGFWPLAIGFGLFFLCLAAILARLVLVLSCGDGGQRPQGVGALFAACPVFNEPIERIRP